MMYKLFITFAKIGLFTFGGGYAMLPILKTEIVTNNGWITDDELTDYFTVSAVTPGAIAVNTAAFVGYKLKGIIGAIICVLGIITPSFFIILALASFMNGFMDIQIVKSCLNGIKVAVCALILNVIINLIRKNIATKIDITILLIALMLTFVTTGSNIIIVALCITLIYNKFVVSK